MVITGKKVFFLKKKCDTPELNKQQRSLHTRAPISVLPSNINTINTNLPEGGVKRIDQTLYLLLP